MTGGQPAPVSEEGVALTVRGGLGSSSSTAEDPEDVVERRKGRPMWQRLAVVIGVVALLYLVGRLTGASELLSRSKLRRYVAAAGPLGALLLCMAFSVGELLHVPGVVFIAVGAAAFPLWWACIVNYAAALCSVSTTFAVVRGAGGQLLAEVSSPLLQRGLRRLDSHPIATVALLRSVLFVAPVLNYALAASPLRYREYLLGSALGLATPVTVMTIFADKLIGAVTEDAPVAT
eukprot:TRINITY_DN44700_c0_g1_i1.p1 TRINITY_DN44700_c0_g1~~TRINITY_DN44700_c0_g1_i1.p1  ORF type:complete len:255 (+),score=84.19 TRINITY_DN44700_c0_g1_i1:69-767(+)